MNMVLRWIRIQQPQHEETTQKHPQKEEHVEVENNGRKLFLAISICSKFYADLDSGNEKFQSPIKSLRKYTKIRRPLLGSSGVLELRLVFPLPYPPPEPTETEKGM